MKINKFYHQIKYLEKNNKANQKHAKEEDNTD